MWRQGDILIQRVDTIPEGLVSQKRLVLASSDSTGHKHQIKESRSARLFADPERLSNDLYLEVTAEATELVHPEHGAIRLEKGRYRIWRQREFTEFGSRTILD